MKSVTAVLLGMMVMGTSAGVWAAGAAPAQQLEMKASLTGGTCTVGNKDAVVTFPEIMKADWDQAGTTGSHIVNQHLVLHVDCSANGSYNNVHMTPKFSSNNESNGYGTAVGLTGSAKDAVGLRLFRQDDYTDMSPAGAFKNGQKESYALANNMVDIDMYPGIEKALSYTAGDYTGTVTLDFDFD